jgi:hypothetical protein
LKNLNVPQPLSGGFSASRFQAAKAMAFTLVLADPDFLEPELIARKVRNTSMASPELEGCSGPYGWRDYGIYHDGRLEVDVGGEAIFIFTDSSPCDCYEHFGPGQLVNLRDDKGNEMIFRVGGVACMPLDEWTRKLT